MLALRPYQAQAVEALRGAYRGGARRLLLVAPTGAGKTVVAGHLVASAHDLGRRVLYVAHRWELLEQPRRILEACGLRVGVIAASRPTDPGAPVQVASIQTLASRARRQQGAPDPGPQAAWGDLPPADLVIVDEAHRAVTQSYQCLDRYPVRLGLTATPWRLDGRGLGDAWDDLTEVATVSGLVGGGWLVAPQVYAPHVPDLGRPRGADYTARQISSAMDRGDLVGDVVDHWQRLAAGRPTVCFASSIDHSVHLRDRFLATGIAAEHVDGTTPSDERAAILARLESGATTIVSNVDIITEGYDLPSLSCAVVARPTASLSKHLQMLGRIMRPHAGKPSPIVLDHAGNVHRHGLPDEEHAWSLEGREDRSFSTPRARVCSYCFRVCPPLSTKCPHCGKAFPMVARDSPIKKERRGELMAIVAKKRGERTSATDKAAKYEELQAEGRLRGYRPGWAKIQFRLRFGRWP